MKIKDINMYYELHGEGKPVVLIAGLGTGMSLFAGTIRTLSRQFKVLAFDNRGVGLTDKPEVPLHNRNDGGRHGGPPPGLGFHARERAGGVDGRSNRLGPGFATS